MDCDEDIIPTPYRAPEIMLRSEWDYKVEIRNVAMVVSCPRVSSLES